MLFKHFEIPVKFSKTRQFRLGNGIYVVIMQKLLS